VACATGQAARVSIGTDVLGKICYKYAYQNHSTRVK
jgi:hypothetical protein